MTSILLLDGSNLLHRARSGFSAGEFAVAFNFFRQLRSLVDQFKPTRVFMGLEGHPWARYNLLPEYKANRVVEEGTEKHEQLKDFNRQKALILDLMREHVPVSLVRHPHFECDDTLANIVRTSSTVADFTVVSSDSDFTQLLNDHDNVRLYNPVKKAFVEWPKDVNYVTYKALKGDTSDNIPGVPGFGDKKAMKAAKEGVPAMAMTNENADALIRNVRLVRFERWTDEEAMLMTTSTPTRDWDAVKARFTEWGFQSIVGDKPWTKFVDTFDGLFGSDQ